MILDRGREIFLPNLAIRVKFFFRILNVMLLPVQSLLYNTQPVLPAPVAQAIQHFTPTPFTTGLACYAFGIIALSAWEKWVVPSLKLNSILPDIPLLPGQLTEQERCVNFITPFTASTSTPSPTLQDLHERGKYLVGSVGEVNQFITCESLSHIEGVSIRSPEWSVYYDAEIAIYKERKV